jgi:hypothetical protein
MDNTVVVYKHRTNTLTLSLGYDVSTTPITSEIRVAPDPASTKIADWVVTFKTNGVDGELILTMDNTVAGAIEHKTGFMDFKRMVNGEPVIVIDEPLPVVFQGVVTA